MKFAVVPSLAEPVGTLWKNLQAQYTKRGLFYVASPLSSTPFPIYQWIVDHTNEFSNWGKFRFVLMDEQVERNNSLFKYIPSDDPASYERFAKEKFLNLLRKKINLPRNIILKPNLNQMNKFNPPIHLLVLALGIRGNYANVMPRTSLGTGWYVEKLLLEFRQVHTQKGSKSYEGAKFRDYGMSLGPQQVLRADNVVIIASGEKKKRLVKELKSYGHFDSEFPLSIIYHPKVKDKVQIFLTPDAS